MMINYAIARKYSMENVIEQNIEINETMILLQWNLIKEAQVLPCFLKNAQLLEDGNYSNEYHMEWKFETYLIEFMESNYCKITYDVTFFGFSITSYLLTKSLPKKIFLSKKSIHDSRQLCAFEII